MKNRAVRIALFLLVVLAFAGAGYELAMLDRRAAAMGDTARAFQEKSRQADIALRELRAAQFAYVAAGQGAAFWTARGNTLLAAIAGQVQQLAELEKAAAAAGLSPGGAAPATALDDLATLQRIDASVQAYVREEQRLLASDLIFNDLREADQTLGARIDEARRQMAAAHAAAIEQVRKAQIATAGGAAVFAVLVLLLLVPPAGSRRDDPATTRDISDRAAPSASPEPPWPPASGLGGKTATAVRPTATIVHEPIDLKETAALCTDFARVRDTTGIPALLERAANLLDATGIIIWLDDASSGDLRPSLTFGYPPQALARIRAIPRNDDNATAQAYRERALRVVQEDALSNGAIAAPLLGPEGCVGVMAAEIRRGGEAQLDVQAAATIVAAQIATLVAPASDGIQK